MSNSSELGCDSSLPFSTFISFSYSVGMSFPLLSSFFCVFAMLL